MTGNPDGDDIEYTVRNLQVGIRELASWAKAGADVIICVDGERVGRVIPYVEQPPTPGEATVTIRLPRHSDD